ncbi:phosphatase PAP2 family protein [Microbacteriaceae bacterium VKM Ac-2854]|nr:phosphatase PAP2 family protein [Microbacteriaceae bacterium VKM Ac-2854]
MGTAGRITRRWLVFAVLATIGLVLLYWLAVLTPQGQAVENSGLRGADLVFGRATGTAATTLADVTPLGIVCGGVLAAAIALIRRRPALMTAALGSIALTTIATQILKNWVFARPDLIDADAWYTSGSFPSGHTAAAISIVFALAMVVPARGRTVVLVLGGILVILVGNLTMAASWHRASDVLGADLVAFASAALACAWLSTRAQLGRAPKPARRGTVRLVLIASIVAVLCLAVLAVEGIQYYPNDTKDLTAFFVQQALAVSTSTIAVVGFAIAWRGVDIGGAVTRPVRRVRSA